MPSKKDAILAKLEKQPISLEEYLVVRGSNALNVGETRVLGLRWPLARKWAKTYPGEINKAMFAELVVARKRRKKEKKDRTAKRAKPTNPAPKPFVRAFEASDEFLHSYEWRKLRMVALETYGARCMACGAEARNGATIHVDHIKPRRNYPELALRLDNLQILCEECNHGKGNWSERDWRSGTEKEAIREKGRTCSCPPWEDCECPKSLKDRYL